MLLTIGKRRAFAACAVLLSALVLPGTAPAFAAHEQSELPLGPPGLAEQRTTVEVTRGVSLTTITRGAVSPSAFWTISVPIAPSGSLVESLANAQATQQTLAASNISARVEAVESPQFADYPAGTIGYRVRVGNYPNSAAAYADWGPVFAAIGNRWWPSVHNTGEDGVATTGPWALRVLTIDPKQFKGRLETANGTNFPSLTKTSQIAAGATAIAAVNGGFFVISPNDGVPGDPAGILIEHGQLLSDATNGRVAMQVLDEGKHLRIGPLSTATTLTDAAGEHHPVDGVNRAPGTIRNCGGDADDQPTALPLHDVTCTDSNELVVFNAAFGAATPTGNGTQVTTDAAGTVTCVGDRTGTTVPPGGQILQGIGTEATWLTAHVRVGERISVRTVVRDAEGKKVDFDRHDSVINGGPQLIAAHHVDIHPRADGLIHADAGFFWSWGIRRNPRTMAASTRDGKILLVTADGRQAGSNIGLTLQEAAAVLRSLDAESAMNLDGGGSTTMVVNGQVVNTPSDGTERAVGSALVLVPR